MDALKKLLSEIASLPRQDYESLRRWFWDRDWQEWDREIEADSKNGKLDFLIEEALREKEQIQLLDAP